MKIGVKKGASKKIVSATVKSMFMYEKSLFAICERPKDYLYFSPSENYIVVHVLTGALTGFIKTDNIKEGKEKIEKECNIHKAPIKDIVADYWKYFPYDKLVNCNEKVLKYARKNVKSWGQSVWEKQQGGVK